MNGFGAVEEPPAHNPPTSPNQASQAMLHFINFINSIAHLLCLICERVDWAAHNPEFLKQKPAFGKAIKQPTNPSICLHEEQLIGFVVWLAAPIKIGLVHRLSSLSFNQLHQSFHYHFMIDLLMRESLTALIVDGLFFLSLFAFLGGAIGWGPSH